MSVEMAILVAGGHDRDTAPVGITGLQRIGSKIASAIVPGSRLLRSTGLASRSSLPPATTMSTPASAEVDARPCCTWPGGSGSRPAPAERRSRPAPPAPRPRCPSHRDWVISAGTGVVAPTRPAGRPSTSIAAIRPKRDSRFNSSSGGEIQRRARQRQRQRQRQRSYDETSQHLGAEIELRIAGGDVAMASQPIKPNPLLS